jgi:hypothetical protein
MLKHTTPSTPAPTSIDVLFIFLPLLDGHVMEGKIIVCLKSLHCLLCQVTYRKMWEEREGVCVCEGGAPVRGVREEGGGREVQRLRENRPSSAIGHGLCNQSLEVSLAVESDPPTPSLLHQHRRRNTSSPYGMGCLTSTALFPCALRASIM